MLRYIGGIVGMVGWIIRLLVGDFSAPATFGDLAFAVSGVIGFLLIVPLFSPKEDA